MSWTQTYTGKKFDIFNPLPEDIVIEDIAHALAMKCRFNGHTKSFYSVAQHSVLVAEHCKTDDPKIKMLALLHDAAEAYLTDVPTPYKKHVSFVTEQRISQGYQFKAKNRFVTDFFYVEDKILTMILKKFIEGNPNSTGVIVSTPEVFRADRLLLYWEKRDLLLDMKWSDNGNDVKLPQDALFPWDWSLSKHRFLEMFRTLEAEIADISR